MMKRILIIVFLFSSFLSAQTLIDSYSESNYSASSVITSTGTSAWGQSFTGNGNTITSVKFYLCKTGSPSGNCSAKLYSHSGTYGSSSVPNLSPLLGEVSISASTIPTDFSLVTFTFSSPINITYGSYYVIVFEYTSGDGSNYIRIGSDTSSPTHSGNSSYRYNSTWYTFTDDTIFYVYGTVPTTFIPQITIIN